MFEPKVTLTLDLDHVEQSLMSNRESFFDRKPMKAETAPSTLKENLASTMDCIAEVNPEILEIPFKVYSLAISSDERNIIFGSNTGNLAIWDRDLRGITSDTPLNTDMIYSLLLTKDERFIIAAGADSTIRVFENPSFLLVKELGDHSLYVNKLSLSHDGNFLYSTSKDCTVRRWNLQTLQHDQILLRHSGASIVVCVSWDGCYVFSGGEDQVVKVYSLTQNALVEELVGHKDFICSLAVSNNNKYLASGSSDSQIYLWDTFNFHLLRSFKDHTLRVECLKFVPNNLFLVSGSFDCTIKVWDLESDKEPITLAGHEKPIMEVDISILGTHIFSCSEDQTIRIWPFPPLKSQRVLRTHTKITAAQVTTDNQCLLTGGSDAVLRIWDLWTGELLKELVHHTKCINQILVLEEAAITCSDDGSMLCWNLGNFSNSENLSRTESLKNSANFGNIENFRNSFKDRSSIHTRNIAPVDSVKANVGPIKAIGLNLTAKLVCSAGADARITCWQLPGFKQLEIMRGHRQWIWALELSSGGDLVVSGSSDKTIRVWSLKTYQELACMKGHRGKITCMKFGKEDKYLVSGSTDKSVRIWSMLDFGLQLQFDCHTAEVTSLVMSPDKEYIISSGNDKRLCIFYLKERVKIAELSTFEKETHNVILTRQANYIVTCHTGGIHIVENPMKTQQFQLVGPSEEEYLFISYIYKLFNDPEPPMHSPQMDKWLIVPYFFNALHFYAYYNFKSHLSQSLQNNCPLIHTSSGDSALTLALNRDLKECTESLVLSSVNRAKENPNTLLAVEDSISLMNEKGYGVIEEFYKNVFVESQQSALPKFCSDKVKLPRFYLSSSTRVDPVNLISSKDITPEGHSIQFKESYIRVPLELGSQGSLYFLKSLLNCSNQKIFITDFIQHIMFYKWSKVKVWIYIHTLVYLLYMVFFSLHIVYLYDGSIAIYLLLVINSLLALYECLQFVLAPKYYLQDIWNYLDICRSTSCFIFLYLDLADSSSDLKSLTLIVTTMLSWLRGITYFRISKRTRYLINLLKEVVTDMIPFLIIFFYSTMAFSFCFLVIHWEDSRNDYDDFWTLSYRLDLGDFSLSNYELSDWIIFFLATLVNPIIMLNLLISIISDTYSRVQSDVVVADMMEMCEMILEIESLIFWRRKKQVKNFLHVCTIQDVINYPRDEISDKIQEFNLKLEDIYKDIAPIRGDIEEYSKKVEVFQKEMSSKQARLEKLLLELKQ